MGQPIPPEWVDAYELYLSGWPPSEGIDAMDHRRLEMFLLLKNVVYAIENESDFDP